MLLAPSMTDFQQRVSELFDTIDPDRIEFFIKELEDWGIYSEEHLDDAYYGCYPSTEGFVEDLCEDCYSDVIASMPTFMQTALDYELMGINLSNTISLLSTIVIVVITISSIVTFDH